MKRIFLINGLIFLTSFILIEIFFGYWFSKYNFGIHMRDHRQISKHYSTKFEEKIYNFHYKRNFYGFRGDEVNPENIKIVFFGGSTGNQQFTPEKYTIVEQLTKLLNQVYENKIYNSSIDGKTTLGYIYDLKYWFPKIPNFKPEIFLFYVGINDSFLDQPGKWDYQVPNSNVVKFMDFIKNSSIAVELIKKIKIKYFNNLKIRYDATAIEKDLYKNFKYINLAQAKLIHDEDELLKVHKTLIHNFVKRLDSLITLTNHFNATPIFITQVEYNGLAREELFLINQTLKKYCNNKNIFFIELDNIINASNKDFFEDQP